MHVSLAETEKVLLWNALHLGTRRNYSLEVMDAREKVDPVILEASSVASDQDRFDAAFKAFRDLSEGLYDIDTRQCAKGVTNNESR